jgi:ATPase subunit of ABC transporter with duplicated ATPase domains
VSELATRVLEVTPGGLRDFPGTYAEYLQRCGDDHLDANAVVLKSKAEKATARRAEAAGEEGGETALSWEEQKRRRNRLAGLPTRRDKVLASIEAAESRRKAIADLYAEAGFFERTTRVDAETLAREDAELTARIRKWMSEWEEMEKEIAAAG